MNILLTLERNYHLKYLNRQDHLRFMLKDLTALWKRYPYLMEKQKKVCFFPGFGEINYDIVNQIFNFLLAPLKFIFDLSLKSGTFPEKMKITQFTPVFISGYTSIMINYRSISLLPCLSKMLERIMYNRLYKYLTDIFFYYTVINLDFKRDTLQGMQFFSWLNK